MSWFVAPATDNPATWNAYWTWAILIGHWYNKRWKANLKFFTYFSVNSRWIYFHTLTGLVGIENFTLIPTARMRKLKKGILEFVYVCLYLVKSLEQQKLFALGPSCKYWDPFCTIFVVKITAFVDALLKKRTTLIKSFSLIHKNRDTKKLKGLGRRKFSQSVWRW